MNEFILKNLINCDYKELTTIGFDTSYAKTAKNKYQYKNIKIFDLSQAQANILKQTALSVGADCAVHKGLITAEIDKTDCILGGSFSQLFKISQKLKMQPFKLKDLANYIENILDNKLKPIKIKKSIFDFTKPYIVGILNLTNNSFSDGGKYYKFNDAQKHLLQMIEDGADVIDIGAESTKPYSEPVCAETQLEKIIPLLEFVKKEGLDIPLSIDTRSALVAQESIKHGADIINDVSGLEFDGEMINVVSKYDKPVIIQHSSGTPQTMQENPSYKYLIDDVYKNLFKKIDYAINNGVKIENIIVDVGIGFGKTKEQNFELLSRIQEFYSLNTPVMVGVSRKSLLDMPNESNEVKDIFTLALNSSLIDKGVNFLRVHNVKLTKELISLKF